MSSKPSKPPTPSPPNSVHSSNPSASSLRPHQHAPMNPSQLRETHLPSPSPEASMSQPQPESRSMDGFEESAHSPPESYQDFATTNPTEDSTQEHVERTVQPDIRTRLRKQWDQSPEYGQENSNHGIFSSRPSTQRSYGSFMSMSDRSIRGFGGRFFGGIDEAVEDSPDATHALLGDTIADGVLGGARNNKISTTEYLAKRYGVRNRRWMYFNYYIPITNWIPQYRLSYLKGDLIAAITMASFYIPMSLSLASNLGHVPPINGMYSFVFNPIVYAILGTCPQMVVGPEAAGSLLTGTVVKANIEKGGSDDNGEINSEIGGIVTCMAGGVIFLSGLFRLGFLDNVLSRPFLRGFISAIGVVIFIDQLLPEMGLTKIASHKGGVSHGSCLDKVIFIFQHWRQAHGPTCAVSFGAFGIIMLLREVKKRLQPRYPSIAYVPDRFIVVVLSAVLAWRYEFDKKGIEVLGNVKAGGSLFRVHFPFKLSHLKYASDAFTTSFSIALLGFFESSVAAKSLGSGEGKAITLPLSANRELVALGVANMLGGLFMALPAFGGYGRSKVNASTGGKTPMSSVFLSVITLLCVFFLLPYFYYLPRGVLSAMISVVAYSLVEEAPHDIEFFWRIRGWSELILMFVIFLATVFWDIKVGIAVGIGLSLLRVVRHSTRPRIQILGRVPGTDRFENAEADPGRLEFIEGCLIVKIPEPLTFANTGDLRHRLKRLEEHGTIAAHPALPRVRREEHNKNLIFDVHGVTSLDGAGAQVLADIVESYRNRGVRVFFCRVSRSRKQVWRLFEASGIVEMCGGESHFVNHVDEALKMTEVETVTEEVNHNDRTQSTERGPADQVTSR